jgi:chromate transporter
MRGDPQIIAPSSASLDELFGEFLKVSLLAFGGGMVWARRAVVDRRHWLDDRDFADILSLCQFLPGPNVVGIAVCVGARLRGWRGAVAAVAGFILIPGSLGFALGVLFLRHSELKPVQGVLGGVSAAAAGLLIAMALRLFGPHRARPTAWLFAALALIGIAVVKLPLPVVVLGLTPLSVAAAGFRRPA